MITSLDTAKEDIQEKISRLVFEAMFEKFDKQHVSEVLNFHKDKLSKKSLHSTRMKILNLLKKML
jgi:hypothetical protein